MDNGAASPNDLMLQLLSNQDVMMKRMEKMQEEMMSRDLALRAMIENSHAPQVRHLPWRALR